MTSSQIKTASHLKQFVESAGHESHFFTRPTMRFFGDTMKNYGVRGPGKITDLSGETRNVFELYRRRPVKHGLHDSAYFDAETFKRVFPAT